MLKKPLFVLVAALAAVGGIVGMSAYEAYVVHVTANIDNSMAVSTDAVDFGNVFPDEEMISDPFMITPSDSFNDQDRVNYIDYVIKQQPVPLEPGKILHICNSATGTSVDMTSEDYCLNYSEREPGYRKTEGVCTDVQLDYDWFCNPNLCPYLSKEVTGYPGEIGEMDTPWEDREEELDYGVSAFHDPADEDSWASGRVWLDGSDSWAIDLEVPCFYGQCGPDWEHEGYELYDDDDDVISDYKCDLWIEVTEVGYSDED
jgi:hypothetical protein